MNETDEDLFEINWNLLDQDWAKQPKLVYKHCKLLAEAEEKRDRAKAEEDVIKDDLKAVAARLDLSIRKNPEKFALEKVTEGAVEKTVILQREYIEALGKVRRCQNKVIDANRDVGICEAVVKALDNKKSGLGDMVKLFGMAYNPYPKLDQNTKNNVQERQVDAAFGKKKGVEKRG